MPASNGKPLPEPSSVTIDKAGRLVFTLTCPMCGAQEVLQPVWWQTIFSTTSGVDQAALTARIGDVPIRLHSCAKPDEAAP